MQAQAERRIIKAKRNLPDKQPVYDEEGNELSLAFDGVDTSDTYVFVVSIVDQAGNVSEEWTQNCVPADD